MKRQNKNQDNVYEQALCGGRLNSGHMEMIRMTINRKMDANKMFAVWRIDPPWQPLTRKVNIDTICVDVLIFLLLFILML